jgi:hypothetical protein
LSTYDPCGTSANESVRRARPWRVATRSAVSLRRRQQHRGVLDQHDGRADMVPLTSVIGCRWKSIRDFGHADGDPRGARGVSAPRVIVVHPERGRPVNVDAGMSQLRRAWRQNPASARRCGKSRQPGEVIDALGRRGWPRRRGRAVARPAGGAGCARPRRAASAPVPAGIAAKPGAGDSAVPPASAGAGRQRGARSAPAITRSPDIPTRLSCIV